MHKGAKRNQNIGASVLAKWPKMAAKMIIIDPKGFTGTTWHRSGATTIADNGESAINLKHAEGDGAASEGDDSRKPAEWE
eukprot:15201611-Ditylum_brightwellii.AAC.1